MKRILHLSVAIIAIAASTLSAQEEPGGYHLVVCLKIAPGKAAEFNQFVSQNGHKLAQSDADSGTISEWLLSKSVIPQGQAATCDDYVVILFPALPPPPEGSEALAARLKAAGIPMSAEEFVEKRGSLAELVSLELWRNQIAVGRLQKGDYLYLNRMKVPSLGDWINTEKKIWQPMAEQWVKDGAMDGWFLNVAVLPGGSERKYQATTVDVFPSWERAMRYGDGIDDMFKKVHPDMDIERAFEDIGKARDLAVQELLRVEDVVQPAK